MPQFFIKAAAKGDLKKLRSLLDAEQSVDARDTVGRTALMHAAEHGQTEAVKLLLGAGAGAKVLVKDRDSIWNGCSAVIFAAQSGKHELVEMLIQAGSPVTGKAADGTTALNLAVRNGSTTTVKSLLQAGAPLDKDILVTCLWEGKPEMAVLLVEAGADPNSRDDLGQPVLHKAAESGQTDVVRALIRAKAKLDQKANGTTPLLVTIHNAHEECALELIQAGADASITGLGGRNVLMNAALTGQTRVVEALLAARADPNAKDKEGKTALMLANEQVKEPIVKLLIDAGSDLSGYKVLENIRAAYKGDVALVRQFLAEGVDVNAVYQNGASALMSAVKGGHAEVVRLLIESGGKVRAKTTVRAWGLGFETDALSLAAEQGGLEIVRLLIGAGVEVNESRMFGQNPLKLASQNGHEAVVLELLRAGFSTRGKAGLEALEAALWKKSEACALALLNAGIRPSGKHAAKLLVSAAEHGLARVVKAMLDAGVDPKARNEYDETALQVARRAGHKDVLALLQESPSPQDSPALEFVEAAERGDLKTVRRLMLEGVELEARDAKGATALIRASAGGHLWVMKSLIAAGADPNASTQPVKRDKKKWFHHMDLTSETPLSCAVAAGNLAAVEMLLAAGADLRKTECGHLACMILQKGTKAGAALVERLLDAGMDPDARWPEINVCALEIAAQEGHTSLVSKLIRAGARLTDRWARDRTITGAISKKRPALARQLIEEAVAPALKGAISAESLVSAATEGFDDVIGALLDRGSKVDARTNFYFELGIGSRDGSAEKITALMAAARHGRISTVEYLLRRKADPKVKDAFGQTALDWARDADDSKVQQKICHLLENAVEAKRH